MRTNETRSIDSFAPRGAAKDLIMINVIVFVLQHVFGLLAIRYNDGSISPLGALSLGTLKAGQYQTLFTHLFVHQGLWHLVGNMLMVHFAGKLLQGTGITNRSFLGIYFAAGVGAGLLEIFVGAMTGNHYALIGASGAAFGLALAAVVARPAEPITAMIFFVIPVHMKLRNLGKSLILVSLFLGMLQLLGIYQMGIAHFAHLGGAIIGLLIAKRLGLKDLPYAEEVSRSPVWANLWGSSKKSRSVIDVAGEVISSTAPETEVSILERYGCNSLQDFVERVLRPLLRKREFFGDESLSDQEKHALEEGRWLMDQHGYRTI